MRIKQMHIVEHSHWSREVASSSNRQRSTACAFFQVQRSGFDCSACGGFEVASTRLMRRPLRPLNIEQQSASKFDDTMVSIDGEGTA